MSSSTQAKRKAPLGFADINSPTAPAKKNKTGQAGTSTNTAAAKKKFQDQTFVGNKTPVEATFIHWGPAEAGEDADADDEGDDEFPPGSLQAILNGLENERAKAVHEALNPPDELNNGCRVVNVGEMRAKIEEASKPYREKMEEERQKLVKAGTMTAEEAKAIVGQDDETRKEKKQAKKNLQTLLNRVEKEKIKAIDLVRARGGLSSTEKQRKVAEASRWTKSERREVVTAEEARTYVPNIGGEAEDDGKNKEKEVEEVPRTVTDKGFPVTKAGFEKMVEINKEVDKRDPDCHDMYIYNDFAGYGVIEVLKNVVIEFNKIIFKKDESPYKKWTIVEGLTLYLLMGDHMALMMNDNSDGIKEVLDMLGVMYITALEMLHECALTGPTSPLPDNLGVMTLFFLDFMRNTASNFDIDWAHEIVRAADAYGVVLAPVEHVKGVDQGVLDDLRETCERTKKKMGLAWKTEFPKFKREHPGGHEFDITKMPEQQKAQHRFGGKKDYEEMNEGSDDDYEFF